MNDYDDDNETEDSPPTVDEVLNNPEQGYYMLERKRRDGGSFRPYAKSLSKFPYLNDYLNLDTDPDFIYRIKRYIGVPLSTWAAYPLILAPTYIPSPEEVAYMNKLAEEGDVVGPTEPSENIVLKEVSINESFKNMRLRKRLGAFVSTSWEMFRQMVLLKGSR